MTAKGYTKLELIDAGLAVAGKNGGIYDKFRARLMLPVIDVRGDVAGFTSRILPGLEGAKYLNSPETSIFKKGRLIYALNFAKNTKRPNLVLVEGNIDVITLHQAGFDNVVATMGTALTEEHARILARYGDHPQAMREAGIAYAIDQISDLIAAGVDGIHLYTMNNPQVARQISDSISAIRSV